MSPGHALDAYIWGEMGVESEEEFSGWEAKLNAGNVQMDDHPTGVDACVCATGSVKFRAWSEESCESVFD